MDINIYSFLLPIIAGFSTLIGTILIFFKFKNKNNIILGSLGFASGVMLTISFIDLIPEAINSLKTYFLDFPTIIITCIFFVVGVIISIMINKYLPKYDSKLYKVGVVSMLAIILHNIPEGIVTFMATSTNINLGIAMTLAIAFHNIPEGISISVPIYYSSKKKGRALLYTFISALSEPLGAILAFIFLKNYINNFILGILFAIIAGIMTHISIYELIPTSFSYKNKKLSLIYIILGIFITLLTHFIFG